jgi:hypothetical protein
MRSNVVLFKSTFKLQRSGSSQADMAGKLFEQGDISAVELEELRNVDYNAQMEAVIKHSASLYAGEPLLIYSAYLAN